MTYYILPDIFFFVSPPSHLLVQNNLPESDVVYVNTNIKHVNGFAQSMLPRLLWTSVLPDGSLNMHWAANNWKVKLHAKRRENRLTRLQKTQKEKQNQEKNAPKINKLTKSRNCIVSGRQLMCGRNVHIRLEVQSPT